MGDTIQLQGIAKIPDKLKWNNSANILCNYMKELEFLEKILKNKAIIPRYVIEPLDYLKIEELHRIAFPMTCFCDIPLSKVFKGLYNRTAIIGKKATNCNINPR